jgi:hypothetical protein
MSKIEVDAIDKQSGSTLTLGGSGTAVTLASGATQTGFGRTGTVDWQTSIKTSTITAVNGEGYFVNTSGGAITANLPAGVVGAIVSFKDYAQTFDTNALTISANASEKIEGQTFDLILGTEGQATTLVYGDATKGWQAVNSNEITNIAKFVTATGGTITCSGDYKIHTFTGPGTLCVSCAGNPAGSTLVDYLVVAGGAGGGGRAAGGGGAGGFRESPGTASGSYTVSPLGASPAVALPVSVQGYTVTVGGGGTAGPGCGCVSGNGNPSTFSTITSTGGGGTAYNAANPGGSGGGAGRASPTSGGAGNTPPVNPAQGQNGGDGQTPYKSGGGGGAGAIGTPAASQSGGGPGGNGVATSITGSSVTRAGGGGGARPNNPPEPSATGTGGSGGGGGGGGAGPGIGTAGTTNTGGGGGGGYSTSPGAGGAGGSGIVIIRYKFQ